MLYRNSRVFLNGEAVALPESGRSEALRLLRTLADRRGLDAVQTARALRHPALRATLQAWQAAGWIESRGRTQPPFQLRRPPCAKDRDAIS